MSKYNSILSFIYENGRFISANDDYKLYTWYFNKKYVYKTLDDTEKEKIDEIEKFRTHIKNNYYDRILEFINTNKRFFSQVFSSERKYYQWFIRKQSQYDILPDEEKLKIQEIINLKNKYIKRKFKKGAIKLNNENLNEKVSDEVKTIERYNKIILYIKENNRFLNKKYPEEKKDYNWFVGKKHRYSFLPDIEKEKIDVIQAQNKKFKNAIKIEKIISEKEIIDKRYKEKIDKLINKRKKTENTSELN